MDKAVDSFIDSDKDSKIGYVLYLARNCGPNGVFLRDDIPWI